MWMKWIQDLRFVIGLFFAIVSVILFFAGVMDSAGAELNLNLLGSLYLSLFASLMLALGVRYCES